MKLTIGELPLDKWNSSIHAAPQHGPPAPEQRFARLCSWQGYLLLLWLWLFLLLFLLLLLLLLW